MGHACLCKSHRAGRFLIAQVSATGGDTVPFSTPFQNVALDNISPDKSELLISTFTGNRIRAADVGVAGAGRFTAGDWAIWSPPDATWMPNGDMLISKGNTFQVLNLNTNVARRLVNLPDFSYWMRWSPDGSTLRFTVDNTATSAFEIWEMTADGKRMQPVLKNGDRSQEESHGKWTADGKYFVFQRERNGRADLWAIPRKRRFSAHGKSRAGAIDLRPR